MRLARGEPAVCLSLAQTLHETARASELEEVAATAEHLRGEALLAQGRAEAAAEALAAARRSARRIGGARLILDLERATARLGEDAEADRWSALIDRSLEGTPLRAAL